MTRPLFACITASSLLAPAAALHAVDLPAAQAQPHEAWLSGSLFHRELDRPVNILRTNISVREMLHRLSEIHRVAILLDRRIDPDRRIDVQLTQTTLLEGLRLLASQWNAEVADVGSTLYIAPPEALDRTLTLIEQIQSATLQEGQRNSGRQLFELSKGHTFAWEDLTRPVDLLREIAATGHLRLEQSDAIPHDLWASGVLAGVSVVEALTLVLGQYDLACRLTEDGSSAEIYSETGRVTVERPHTPRGISVAQAEEQIREQWPHVSIRAEARQLIVNATALEHARIADAFAPSRSADPSTDSVSLGPLSSRQFTFQVVRKPFSAILRTLEANDMIVEYDAQTLQQAGIDLDTKISVKLEKASADQLFQALCDEMGLNYRIRGKSVEFFVAP